MKKESFLKFITAGFMNKIFLAGIAFFILIGIRAMILFNYENYSWVMAATGILLLGITLVGNYISWKKK